jgi:hypothetical protein
LREDYKDKLLMAWVQEHGEQLGLRIMMGDDKSFDTMPDAVFSPMVASNLAVIILLEKIADRNKFEATDPLFSTPMIEGAINGIEKMMEEIECDQDEFVAALKVTNKKIQERDPEAYNTASSCVYDEESAACFLIPFVLVYRHLQLNSIEQMEKTGLAAIKATPAYFIREFPSGAVQIPAWVPPSMHAEYRKLAKGAGGVDPMGILSNILGLRAL